MVTSEDLLQGGSLRVILVPDPSRPHNNPEITESLELSNIVIDKDKFWGITSSLHSPQGIAEVPRDALLQPCVYAYSNYTTIVVNGSRAWNFIRVNQTKAYTKIEFVVIANYRLVWERGANEDVGELRRAIMSARRVKIALLDQEGFWNIHLVHQPTIVNGKDHFELFTDSDCYPDCLRQTAAMMALGQKLDLEMQDRQRQGSIAVGVTMGITGQYACWRVAMSNGLNRRAVLSPGGDQLRTTLVPYQALKVFVET